jgi:hypothetical protein
MSKFYLDKKTIDVPFPDEIFEIYLKRFNVESEDKLNDVNIFEIVKACYRDFKKGFLALDDFSSIGGYLFDKLTNNTKDRRFGSVLLDIGELNFYIRVSGPKQKFLELNNFLSEIDNFFKQYKG